VRGDKTEERERGGVRVVTLDRVFGGPPVEPVEAGPWDTFCLAYTSRTTGLSKGAWIPNAHAIINQAGAQYVHIEFGSNDVFLVVCPIFHVSGLLAGLVGAWRAGAYAHIVDRFHATTFWEEVDKVGATNTYLVGTMAEFLLRQPPSPDDARHTLRSAMMLPLHPEAKQMAERFGVRLSTGYGNTETGCCIICVTKRVSNVDQSASCGLVLKFASLTTTTCLSLREASVR
jgi:crotonobetaine/carnitine-CoA ligase